MDRPLPELIGHSAIFLDTLAHASGAATFDRPLLIVGERGTGKELIAERVHYLSPRWKGPLVKVNCAALSEELLESELFGHEAGAFTGARARHKGRFERAEGGTLFLDEIASASSRVQEKLLRVIEYGEYERVGGEATITADVRVIAAANADLRAAADADAFRWDLLDRLAFDVVSAPPLRERQDDIPLLAAHFAMKFAQEQTFRDPAFAFAGFAPEGMATLKAHDWPGNVRELKNVVERSFYRWTSSGAGDPIRDIVIDAFGPKRNSASSSAVISRATSTAPLEVDAESAEGGSPYDLRKHLDAVERALVHEALEGRQWSQKRAADFLNLTYDQMRGLVRKHRLTA
jgi:psp operon transcriptional activator